MFCRDSNLWPQLHRDPVFELAHLLKAMGDCCLEMVQYLSSYRLQYPCSIEPVSTPLCARNHNQRGLCYSVPQDCTLRARFVSVRRAETCNRFESRSLNTTHFAA